MTRPDAVSQLVAVALVSSGRHRVSDRIVRAEQDARAVEMGLSLVGSRLELLHAGEPNDDALRQSLSRYLGMFHGFEGRNNSPAAAGTLSLLSMPGEGDALSLLETQLCRRSPSLVLCGMRAEHGEGSGMLPYLLAERLGWSMVAGIVAIESIEAESMQVLQALPRGQRRRLAVKLPCIASVSEQASPPRQSAFGAARRGRIEVIEPVAPAPVDTLRAQWQFEPARVRPKRLKTTARSASARERFRAAAAKSEGGGGRVLSDLSPEAAAKKLIEYLESEHILTRPDNNDA